MAKGNGNAKKAPVGKSHGMKNGSPAKMGFKGLHSAGKTVPLFNASRIDGMGQVKGKGGTK